AKSENWHEESFVSPVPALPRGWLKLADTVTPEYRLAAALASLTFLPLRSHLEPLNEWTKWDDSAKAKNEVVWHEGEIIDVLCAVIKRRFLLVKRSRMESWPEFA